MYTDKNHFSLHIEEIKKNKGFDTYIETVVWFHDNETDQEMSEIVKMLNQKIVDSIAYEAEEQKMLKHPEEVVRLC